MINISNNWDEKGLLLLFLLVSSYILIGSFEYQSTAAIFPRITSVIVIVGSFLLLVRGFLPARMQEFLTDAEESSTKSPLTQDDNDQSDNDSVVEESDNAQVTMLMGREISTAGLNRTVTTILIILYVVLSYLIGMLWATPIFVLAYAAYTRLQWYFIIGLPIIGYGICRAFMTVVYLPIETGLLHQWGWM